MLCRRAVSDGGGCTSTKLNLTKGSRCYVAELCLMAVAVLVLN
jgi:hypothetical protein